VETVLNFILNESNLISGQLLQVWLKYIDLFRVSSKFCTSLLQDEYLHKVYNTFS